MSPLTLEKIKETMDDKLAQLEAHLDNDLDRVKTDLENRIQKLEKEIQYPLEAHRGKPYGLIETLKREFQKQIQAHATLIEKRCRDIEIKLGRWIQTTDSNQDEIEILKELHKK